MGDNTVISQQLPQAHPTDPDSSSISPVDIKAKSPTPSDENASNPPPLLNRPDEDGCLIIDDGNDLAGKPLEPMEIVDDDKTGELNNDAPSEVTNDVTQPSSSFVDIPDIQMENEANNGVGEKRTQDESNKEEEDVLMPTPSSPSNKEEGFVGAMSSSTAQPKPIWSAESLAKASTSTVISTSSSSTSQITSVNSQPQMLVDALAAASLKKKPRQRRQNIGGGGQKKQDQSSMLPQLTTAAPNTILGTTAFQVSSNGPSQFYTLPHGYKIQSAAIATPVATSSAPSLRQSGYFLQLHNGQLVYCPNSSTQQASGGSQTHSTSIPKQGPSPKKSQKDHQKDGGGNVSGGAQQPQIMLAQGNYRFQMAPGQQQSPQNIQSFIQNSNISAKQSPPTSKGGQSSNLSQSYISTTPGNLQPTGVFNARGLPSTIPLAFRPAGPNGQIMMTNQMNLIPINVSPNFQYQVAPGTALGIHEIHPPPPTLSPNVAQPSSRSPKSSGEGKKKKLGSSSNGTSSGMFHQAATKFMSDIHRNPTGLSIKSIKTKKEEKIDDGDLNDDEPPPKIECEGNPNDVDSNSRSAQQRHVHNIFVQAANRQHIQKSKLQSRIKSHFVDGRRIEEEIPSKSSSSSINSPSTKQRRVGQPPTLQNIVLNNVKSALNKVTVTAGKATVTSRPLSSNFQPPPIVKPANYNPPPQPPNKELKSPSKFSQMQEANSPKHSMNNGQSSHSTDALRKSRGRPSKTSLDGNSNFNKSSDSTTSAEKPRHRKNREVENLINMDFGPGKTPFATTSADAYTEKILTSLERFQSHVPGYDGRHSRASVSSNASKQQSLNTRRSSHRQSSTSNLSPPASKRPRRDAQKNISYKHSSLFDEEDEEDEDVDEDSRTPLNLCLFCRQPTRDSKMPQYCNDECKRRFKKKQRVERMSSKALNTSSTSTASFKSEPSTSHDSPVISMRRSFDALPSTSSNKIASPTLNGSLSDSNAQELDSLKAMGVRNWTTEHVSRWVELVCGSVEIAAKFAEQEIDGESLLMLEENDLKQDLGLKLGPYMKLSKDLKKIKSLE